MRRRIFGDRAGQAASRFSRRGLFAAFLLAASATAAGSLPALAAAADGGASLEVAQKIADHFSSVKTMTGEFVQLGPRGEQTGGKFFIERPGKIRFNYQAPSNFKVISDGDSVAINNPRLKTWEAYPLLKTPLKLLLDNHIDLSGEQVQSVNVANDLTTIKLKNKSLFGNSTMTLMFDPKSYDLRQWTITDAQGKDTTVMIFNVKEGGAIDPAQFTIDYSKVMKSATANNAR